MARLFYSLKTARASALRSPIEEFIQKEVRTGAILNTPDGLRRVRARKGVVLATGGFARNPKYRNAFMPDPTPPYSMAPASNTGDGVALADALGAGIDTSGQGAGLWSPVSVTRRADGSEGLYPHLAMDRAKPGLIAVNAAGRRFVNEAVSYHDFVEAMYRAHETSTRCRLG